MQKESKKDIAAQYATAGLSGGVGRVIDKATARTVSSAAERAVEIYKKKHPKKEVLGMEKPEKRLTGAGFFIVLGLAIIKDLLDILLAATIVFAMLASLLGIAITFLIVFYLIYNNVKWTIRKIITVVITFLIEFIPIVSAFVPAATLNLLLIKKFENSDRFKKFAEKKAALLAKT